MERDRGRPPRPTLLAYFDTGGQESIVRARRVSSGMSAPARLLAGLDAGDALLSWVNEQLARTWIAARARALSTAAEN